MATAQRSDMGSAVGSAVGSDGARSSFGWRSLPSATRCTPLLLAGLMRAALLLPAAGAAQTAAPDTPSSTTASTATTPAATLASLAWLAGCWASELDEPGSGEQWMAPAGGSMLGMARTLKGGRTVQFEFMQLRESATGLVLIAQPGGRPGAVFAATQADTTAALFERQGADFPQRVHYRLRPDGGLAARIEGDAGGQARAVDFPMRRVACHATRQ